MFKGKKFIAIFAGAIILTSIAFAIRVFQFKPLYPKQAQSSDKSESTFIPIYSDDPITGDKKALHTLIIFEDLACEACKKQSYLLGQLIEKYPKKIKIIWKTIPVTRVPYSTKLAHEYGYCMNKQGQFDYFQKMCFANSENLSENILKAIAGQMNISEKKLNECLTNQEYSKNHAENEAVAKILQVQAVPAIFVNNKQIKNPNSLQEWENILD
jgi:protein-disulfide isomerase